MSPRRPLAVALPLALALGLAASGAAALRPAERSAPVEPYPDFGDLPAVAVVANGRVDQVVSSGDRVFARGGFTTIGRYTGPGRVLDTATGADRPAPVLPSGQVSVTVPDGQGGWYVGGDFGVDHPTSRGGGLQHVLADGTADPDFHATTDGLVSALALQGDTLYVGGDFGHLGAATRGNLGAVSATDGSTQPFRADQDTRVTELEAGAGRVYVGTDHVEAFDPVTGATVPGFVSPTDDGVSALLLAGGRLYVGGARLVAADPVTGATDPAFDVQADDTGEYRFHTLLSTGGTLYAGGSHATVDGRPGRLVALDPATGAADPAFDPRVSGGTGTWPSANGGVFDLAVHGGQLWVGGAFARAGGEPAGNLAVLDPATGARLDVAVPSLDRQVNAVDVSGDAAYVGGHFYLEDPVTTHGIAALDATTLEPVPGFHVTRLPWWGDLVAAPNALYAGQTHFYGYDRYATAPPYFTASTDRVLAYDPDTGAVDRGRTHRVRNLTGLTTVGNHLVVAQRLEDDVKFPRNRIVVYGPHGKVVRAFPVPLRGYLSYLTSVDGDLLAVGSFKRSTAEGYPRNTAMVRFSFRDGARRAYFDPKIDGPVYDAAVQGRTIFASGLFHRVFQGVDFDRPGLTRMSARSGKSEQFRPASFAANRVLLRLSAVGDKLWVGWFRNEFLDAATGEVVDDPTGGRADDISSVVRVRDGLDFGTVLYGVNIAGSSWNVMGYVGRVAD
ncbi:hypothetical protein [Nocardioides aquiterrae]|uniref:Uncharacterized protein n=1 Tax=Nocardioides aquiterrae TaxID=203799 RepID=A0ABP4EY07_9ACTN